jgi:hypothetical protein
MAILTLLHLCIAEQSNTPPGRAMIRPVIGPAPKSRDRQSIFCATSTELEMKTLVWTRGDNFPLDQLAGPAQVPALRQPQHPNRVRSA